MLVRSRKDGAAYECVPEVRERYAEKQTVNRVEIWTLAHRIPKIAKGKILRLIFDQTATVHWTFDDWKRASDVATQPVAIGCFFVDLPSGTLAEKAKIKFTFRIGDKWNGKDFEVSVAGG